MQEWVATPRKSASPIPRKDSAEEKLLTSPFDNRPQSARGGSNFTTPRSSRSAASSPLRSARSSSSFRAISPGSFRCSSPRRRFSCASTARSSLALAASSPGVTTLGTLNFFGTLGGPSSQQSTRLSAEELAKLDSAVGYAESFAESPRSGPALSVRSRLWLASAPRMEVAEPHANDARSSLLVTASVDPGSSVVAKLPAFTRLKVLATHELDEGETRACVVLEGHAAPLGWLTACNSTWNSTCCCLLPAASASADSSALAVAHRHRLRYALHPSLLSAPLRGKPPRSAQGALRLRADFALRDASGQRHTAARGGGEASCRRHPARLLARSGRRCADWVGHCQTRRRDEDDTRGARTVTVITTEGS